MKIVTFLQLYKRPDYLQEQIEAIKNQTVKSEIVLVHNEGGIDFDYPKGLQVIYSNKNMKYHFRFSVGLLFDADYICFFDDDTIPQKKWYENCIETINKHDCLCTSNGRTIIPGKNKWDVFQGSAEDEQLVDFGGHSWFLRKSNLKYMWYDGIKDYTTGEDIMLSANLQIYGSIPTFRPPHPEGNPELWSFKEETVAYGRDKAASYVNNPTHHEDRFKLANYYLSKGWAVINERA